MPVNNAYLIDGRNSYHLAADETIKNIISTLEGQEFLTYQIIARGDGTDTTGYVGIRWLNNKGLTISVSEELFAAPAAINKSSSFIFSVPPEAVSMHPYIRAVGSLFVAKPKLEDGEIATAFDAIDVNKLTYLDANGLYTGTVYAHQVIVSGDTLSNELTSIRAGQIQLGARMSGAEGTLANHSTQITNIKAGEINLLGGFDVSGTKLSKQANGNYIDISSLTGTDRIAAGKFSGTTKTPNFRLLEDGSVWSAGDFTAGAGALKYTKSANKLEVTGEINTMYNGRKCLHMYGSQIDMRNYNLDSSPVVGSLGLGLQSDQTYVIGLSHSSGNKIILGTEGTPYIELDMLGRTYPNHPIIMNKNTVFNEHVMITTGDLGMNTAAGVVSMRTFFNLISQRLGLPYSF